MDGFMDYRKLWHDWRTSLSSRKGCGVTFLLAASLAMVAAWTLEHCGLGSNRVSPLAFVGTIVGLKLGLFAFWPEVSTKGRSLLSYYRYRQALPKPNPLALWNERDPRVEVALFSGNVPTFVLNQEQRMIDWNP